MIGLEPTWDEHVANLLSVFREVRRVMRPDAVCWLNYGDAYAGRNQGGGHFNKGNLGGRNEYYDSLTGSGVKPKDLMLMPARLAIALQDDGWWVRSEVVWHKPDPMPESVTDRPTSAHEKVFLLTKASSYFYDAEAVRQPNTPGGAAILLNANTGTPRRDESATDSGIADWHERNNGKQLTGANLRNVWQFAKQSFPGSHFAVFPDKLAETCIKAGTSAHGVCAECGGPWERETERSNSGRRGIPKENEHRMFVNGANRAGEYQTKTVGWHPTCACGTEAVVPATVFDPFGGAGTTGLVADRLGRNAVLIEISPEYADMARKRIDEDSPMFTEVEAVNAPAFTQLSLE